MNVIQVRRSGIHGKGVCLDNCQVAVSVSLACQAGSLPVAWQYLPEEWAEDLPRREKAGVPMQWEFATKPEITLAQSERLMVSPSERGFKDRLAFYERCWPQG